MKIKFSEDVIPLTDLKINPGKVVNQTKDTHRPILLTSRGRGVAVMQGLDEYEKSEEEREFIKAVAQGLMDISRLLKNYFRNPKVKFSGVSLPFLDIRSSILERLTRPCFFRQMGSSSFSTAC